MATKKKTTQADTAGAKPRAPRKKRAAGETKPTAEAASPSQPKKAAAAKAPKKAATVQPAKTEKARPTHEQIAARAAEIWRETGGTPFDNWIRAERELGG